MHFIFNIGGLLADYKFISGTIWTNLNIVVTAVYEKNITTMMVTHLYQLAKKKYDEAREGCHFLVAERTENGTRTFKMLKGEPTYTSFGTDLFKVLEA